MIGVLVSLLFVYILNFKTAKILSHSITQSVAICDEILYSKIVALVQHQTLHSQLSSVLTDFTRQVLIIRFWYHSFHSFDINQKIA